MTYRLKIGGTSVVTIVAQELAADRPTLVMSEPWPMPANEASHLEFMREALEFNRNALHHLHAAVGLDPLGSQQYRLVWQVASEDRAGDEWAASLRLFALLTDKAWERLPRPGALGRPRPGTEEDTNLIFLP